ncbi:MAG: arsenate reductase family protein [Flavobacteriaceae bacterium]
MNTFFYLSSCDSCKRIINTLDLPENIRRVDLKKNPLSETDLSRLYAHTQSYEALLNKRAQKLKAIDKTALTEEKIKALLLEHYTFLKRPVLLFKDQLFAGNAKSTVEAAKAALHE